MSKGGGSFDIVHPNPAMASEGYRLRHCFIESPTRSDNIYRFTVTTQNLTGSITLPDYYPFLNEDSQVWVSAVDVLGYGMGTVSVDSTTVNIQVSAEGTYNVMVIGTRKVQMMIDFFDNKGGAEYISES